MNTMNPTKLALINLAEEILQTKSFANVSFQALAKGVGIKKGSVYYHFESKEELGEAIIDRAIALLKQNLKNIEHQPNAKQLHVYTNWFAKHIGAAQKLCPGASFAASWDAVPEKTQIKVQQLYRLHQESLSKIIQRGRETKEFALTDKTPEELSTLVFALLQGGLLASRVSQDTEEFDTCKSLALSLVKLG
ncbi:TetR/AcrR family transcriptional regulator [Paraglaciecola arctica]|nr:TetR/AcrR family transcriptional regulator [Paraglaciecola arctica]